MLAPPSHSSNCLAVETGIALRALRVFDTSGPMLWNTDIYYGKYYVLSVVRFTSDPLLDNNNSDSKTNICVSRTHRPTTELVQLTEAHKIGAVDTVDKVGIVIKYHRFTNASC